MSKDSDRGRGYRDIAGIPFRSYADRLLREGIDGLEEMVHRAGASFALADGSGTDLISGEDLAKRHPLLHEVFAARPDCNAVIISCPHFSAEAARAGITIPPVLDDTAQIIGTAISVCEGNALKQIRNTLKHRNACLIRDEGISGVIAVGRTLEQTLAATLITEKSVQAFMEGKLIGGAKPLSYSAAYRMHREFMTGYGRMDERTPVRYESDLPYVISEEEMELRRRIVRCGRQLRSENLVQGTWGNISVRLDDRYMLATPSGLDYERLTPYEIVRVDIDTLEYEGTIRPTSEKSIHAALLRSSPDSKCIIHTHAVSCSVFAAARQEMPVIDEGDRALLGDTAYYAESAPPGSRKLCDAVDSAMKSTGRGCIMGSHGMIVRGDSIEDAVEKCRAMEHAARAYLDKLKKEQIHQ